MSVLIRIPLCLISVKPLSSVVKALTSTAFLIGGDGEDYGRRASGHIGVKPSVCCVHSGLQQNKASVHIHESWIPILQKTHVKVVF